MPEISVIVPVFNAEQYLSQCIDSIRAQTMSDFEVILVDDCSSDESGRICDAYASKYKHINAVHKNMRGGAAAARNTGLQHAAGKCISFVDADDYIDAKMFESLCSLQREYDADIVECDLRMVPGDAPDETAEETVKEEKIEVIAGRELIPRIFQSRYGGSVYVWNKLYRKSLFNDNRFVEGRMCEDTIIMPELYYAAQKVVITNRSFYYYRQSGNSVMRSDFSLKKLDAIYAFQCNRAFFIEHDLSDAKAWLDTTYSFILLKYIKKLGELPYDDEVKKNRLALRKEYYRNLSEFIRNPHFSWKQRLLLAVNAGKLL